MLANPAEPVAPPVSPVNRLLHGALLPSLIRLALPTVIVLFMTTLLSVAET